MKILKLPDLGEGLLEAEVVEWFCQEGETVSEDQPLLSVETAKAIVEIPSPCDGVIGQRFAKARTAGVAFTPTWLDETVSADSFTCCCWPGRLPTTQWELFCSDAAALAGLSTAASSCSNANSGSWV